MYVRTYVLIVLYMADNNNIISYNTYTHTNSNIHYVHDDNITNRDGVDSGVLVSTSLEQYLIFNSCNPPINGALKTECFFFHQKSNK